MTKIPILFSPSLIDVTFFSYFEKSTAPLYCVVQTLEVGRGRGERASMLHNQVRLVDLRSAHEQVRVIHFSCGL